MAATTVRFDRRAVAGTQGPVSARSARARAVRGWMVAAAVYFLAVFHRSSLGVASLEAERRFDISPGKLSTFIILQLGVYAAMQIPTGVLVDRFGPRRLLATAAALMGLAQVLFAVAHSYPLALFARGLLGLGDAMTFVSVLRFAITRFSPRRYPMVVSFTAFVGIAGSVGATVPLTFALRGVGWEPTFGVAALASAVAGLLVWLLLPADTGRGADRLAPSMSSRRATRARLGNQIGRAGRRITTSWAHPGTRLGFWLHFACMSSATSLSVLWGYPYLVNGLGFSPDGASSTLLLSVVTAGVSIVAIGWLTSRRSTIRVGLAFAVCVVTLLGWLVVLVQSPASVPHGYVVVLVCLTAIGGPASAIAFALARDYNGPSIVGTASGVVNVGGFLAAIIAVLVLGAVLDVTGTSPADYRWAVAGALAVQLFGTVKMTAWWLRARAVNLVAQNQGLTTPVAITRRRWDRVVGRPSPR